MAKVSKSGGFKEFEYFPDIYENLTRWYIFFETYCCEPSTKYSRMVTSINSRSRDVGRGVVYDIVPDIFRFFIC